MEMLRMNQSEREKIIKELTEKANKLKQRKPRYLRTPEGKKLLEESQKFYLPWPEMEKIFGRATHTIERTLSFHGVRRHRRAHFKYSDEVLEIIREYYDKSQEVKSKKESNVMAREMVRAVNGQRVKEGNVSLTLNAIRCMMGNEGKYWGWPIDWTPEQEKAVKDAVAKFPNSEIPWGRRANFVFELANKIGKSPQVVEAKIKRDFPSSIQSHCEKFPNEGPGNATVLLKMLIEGDQSFGTISRALNISKDKVADLAHDLCENGHDVRAYTRQEDNWLTLSSFEGEGLDAMPISLNNRKIKIAFISEVRMGAFQSQISLTSWLYKEVFEREGVDFVVVVGGLTVGQPTLTIEPDIFKSDLKKPKPLAEYVAKYFPRAKGFKTYIISARRELANKIKGGANLLNLIVKDREDLAYVGDLEKTFNVRGVLIKVASFWDDNCPKGVSYGLQKNTDNLSDNPPPRIIVAGGMHKRSELPDYGENGVYVYGIPSLHTQMRRQMRRGVRPRLGCLILELDFGKNWEFDIKSGLKAHFINLDSYAVKNDCLAGMRELGAKKMPKIQRQALEWFVSERIISEGELSRRLNKSKDFVKNLVKSIERSAGVTISFSEYSKRYEMELVEKKHFKPLPLRYEEVFGFLTKEGGVACTHFGSNFDLPQVVKTAYQDAVTLEVRRMFHAGDVTEGPGPGGYAGHQNDVKFPDADSIEDYAFSRWPRVKITDTKKPLLQTEMKFDEQGRPLYEEVLAKNGLLQTDAIDGNHDCWADQKIGHHPVRTLAIRMPELLRYLGPKDGKISMDGAIVFEGVYTRLTHGDGGMGYAISTKLQKHISSHRRRGVSKEMPTVLWLAHWHTAYTLFEDELGVMLPCFKSEDEFHLRKDLVSWVGMWVLELYGNSKGQLTRVVSQYRNYRHLAVVNK